MTKMWKAPAVRTAALSFTHRSCFPTWYRSRYQRAGLQGAAAKLICCQSLLLIKSLETVLGVGETRKASRLE